MRLKKVSSLHRYLDHNKKKFLDFLNALKRVINRLDKKILMLQGKVKAKFSLYNFQLITLFILI